MMVVIRYISKVLMWILTILVIIGSIGNFQNPHHYLNTVMFCLGSFNYLMPTQDDS